MRTVMITENDAAMYAEALGPAAEHVGREWCRVLLILDDNGEMPLAGMCWELLNVEEQGIDTVSDIHWIQVWDASAEERLFEEYAGQITEAGAVSSGFELPAGEYAPAKDVLARAGFDTQEGEGLVVEITLREVLEHAVLSKGATPSYIGPLSDRTLRSIRRGIGNCLYHGAKGLLADCASISTQWFDLDVSSYIETDGRISGLFLVHKDPAGALVPQLLFAYGADYQKDLILLVRHSLRQAQFIYPQGTRVLLSRHSQSAKGLIGKLFPGKTGIPVIKGFRKER